ncbi:MAG: type IV secretory system conjugative DNA transfer family protein [Candidatus Magasanikbacteria bacterium]
MENQNFKNKKVPIGIANYRGEKQKFGIKNTDRRRHMYIIGKTGVGKSTLLENMAISDIRNGRGVGVIDPHGELAENLLDHVPESRIEDVVYFNPADSEYPIAINPLEQVSGEDRHLIASSIMGIFKKIWPDVWSARMEYILNNALLALLEYPGATLVGVLRLFNDKQFRQKVVDGLDDHVVKDFWEKEYAQYSERYQRRAVAAIQNKIGQLVTNPLIRNIIGRRKSSINVKEIMDEGKILIVNLSKGQIGEDNMSLLGGMIITKIQMAAMARSKEPNKEHKDFFLSVDEFQNFATDSFASILSEARKYRLSLTLAHQYIKQLVQNDNTKVRDAIIGNVGTMICFRVGADDAEFLEKEFLPDYDENDLVNLPKFQVLVRLMIDGLASDPFPAKTLPPFEKPDKSYRDVIIEKSRKKYGQPKDKIEAKMKEDWEAEDLLKKKEEREKEKPLEDVLKQKKDNQKESPKKPNDSQPENSKNKNEGNRKENKGEAEKKINKDKLKNSIENAIDEATEE